tara:strand:- start:234 stop:827 length:594 start_codon:yes stop_codon:yes gene_type:complete
MTIKYPMDRIIILIFISLFLIIYIISQYRINNVNKKEIRSIVRYSYGDEFYNYYDGKETMHSQEDVVDDNIKEVIYDDVVEGFSDSTIDDTTIIENHTLCPVKGVDTEYTSCIHYPNKIISGLGEIIDYGFLVSISCRSCLDTIQRSLDNQGDYDIIYEDNKFFLTKKDSIQRQVLLECNPRNLHRVKRLVETRSIN